MANETIIINDDLRTMDIPSTLVLLGVESDDDVNRIPFQMPKEYCGFDLSAFQARINFMNENGDGDIYIVDDMTVNESTVGDVDTSTINFTWLVGRNACAYKGNTKFIVCLKKFDKNQNVIQEFNTTVYSLPVLEGLETTEAVVQQNPDIIEYILTMIEEAGSIDLSNYYTKDQVDALKLANPHPLTINGISYDGSAEVEMEIEGGSSQTTETVNGVILHVTDAVPNEAVKALSLYNASGSAVASANIAVTNKNLFRLDLIAAQTVSKGITFVKNANGAIHATGTSSGTYAAAQCTIDKHAFVVGQTYTISSGKKSGLLYVQLILKYTDGTTDYLVASNSPHTFTLAKPVSSVTGSVQITASGVTIDEWIYPMIELADTASAFVNNTYKSMIYNGSTMPVLPDSISNVWSNSDSVANMVMEYWNDPVLAKVNELADEVANIEGEANVIEIVKRNGTALEVTGKAVDISVPTKDTDMSNLYVTIPESADLNNYRTVGTYLADSNENIKHQPAIAQRGDIDYGGFFLHVCKSAEGVLYQMYINVRDGIMATRVYDPAEAQWGGWQMVSAQADWNVTNTYSNAYIKNKPPMEAVTQGSNQTYAKDTPAVNLEGKSFNAEGGVFWNGHPCVISRDTDYEHVYGFTWDEDEGKLYFWVDTNIVKVL